MKSCKLGAIIRHQAFMQSNKSLEEIPKSGSVFSWSLVSWIQLNCYWNYSAPLETCERKMPVLTDLDFHYISTHVDSGLIRPPLLFQSIGEIGWWKIQTSCIFRESLQVYALCCKLLDILPGEAGVLWSFQVFNIFALGTCHQTFSKSVRHDWRDLQIFGCLVNFQKYKYFFFVHL